MVLMMFRMLHCQPCEDLADIMSTLKITPRTYWAHQDLDHFRRFRVSGAPQLILYNPTTDEIILRARGLPDCERMIRTLAE